jgi:hypothetical protein
MSVACLPFQILPSFRLVVQYLIMDRYRYSIKLSMLYRTAGRNVTRLGGGVNSLVHVLGRAQAGTGRQIGSLDTCNEYAVA